MKYFKCGKCQTPYKIDETKIKTTQATVVCVKCGAKNSLRFGPQLTAQSQKGIQQFSLKEGVNTIGRKSEKGNVNIQLNDPYVSRVHALIRLEQFEGKIFISIEDAGSLNGTFNKKKVKIKSALKYPFTIGDYFIIGLTKLSISI